LTRFHGVFSANHRLRAQVVPAQRGGRDVLPHVIMLLDASSTMLPVALGLMGFESFMNLKTKRSMMPSEVRA
jgi:hypothetical protein